MCSRASRSSDRIDFLKIFDMVKAHQRGGNFDLPFCRAGGNLCHRLRSDSVFPRTEA